MDGGACPPPSIAGLARLQRACFSRSCETDCPPGALPTGPWASSLQQLGATYETLLLSSQLLAAATRLEELAVLGGDLTAAPSDASKRFWRWCAEHPALQQLQVELDARELASAAFTAAEHGLRDARPALRVHCHAVRKRCELSEHHFPSCFTREI